VQSHRSQRAWRGVELADDVVRRPIVPRELAIRVRALLRLATLTRETQRRFRRLEAEARIDPLTGLATRAAFRDRIVKELLRAERYQRPLALLIADVDHFKHYNDSLGHPAGDRLLRQVGRMVRGQARQVDFGARYGGDEFAILLPETVKVAAGSMAERLRAAVKNYSFPHRHSQPLGAVTVSIGVAMFPEDGVTPAALVEAADRALYQAKADGRNLVRLAAARARRGRMRRPR
jgi:diguanylate cyclase (GGDEF)-like protein